MDKKFYDAMGTFTIIQSSINTVIFPLLLAIAFDAKWLLLYPFYILCFICIVGVATRKKEGK